MYTTTIAHLFSSVILFTVINAIPTPARDICAPGLTYVAVDKCTSGFVGCMGSEDFCTGEKKFWGSCPTGLGNYYVCANGFKGCTTDVNICSRPAIQTTATIPEPTPATPPTGTDAYPNPAQKCTAPNTWYEDSCVSGFIGCMGKEDFCRTGEKRFWGSCPTGLGNYYVCSNGFKGCTTDVNICSRPTFPF